MERVEGQQILRGRIVEHLRLLCSAEEQLEYQYNVPGINVTVELVCIWFDDLYYPKRSFFSSSFSNRELVAMAKFNQVFDAITTSSLQGKEIPQIELFISTPEWIRLSQAASIALCAFEDKVKI